MSDMEIFYGTWRVREDIIVEQYEDWDWLEGHWDNNPSVELFRVGDVIYSAEPIREIDQYGFSIAIPNNIENQVICYWYNGGASLSEVLSRLVGGLLAGNE